MVVITVTKKDDSDFRVQFIVEYHLENHGMMPPDQMQSPLFSTGTKTLTIPAVSMKVTIFAYPWASSSSANGKKIIFDQQFPFAGDLNFEVQGNFNNPYIDID